MNQVVDTIKDENILKWYAIYTRSRHEFKVNKELSQKQFDTFLPVVNSLRRWKDRKKYIEIPLFPGYLFINCQMDDYKHLEILKTKGVVRILGPNRRELYSVPDDEVESIKILIENRATISYHPYVKEGDHVEIVRGPLAGAKGILIEKDMYKSTVVVSIHLLGRSISIEVDSCNTAPFWNF